MSSSVPGTPGDAGGGAQGRTSGRKRRMEKKMTGQRGQLRPVVVDHQMSTDRQMQIFTSYHSRLDSPRDDDTDDCAFCTLCCCCCWWCASAHDNGRRAFSDDDEGQEEEHGGARETRSLYQQLEAQGTPGDEAAARRRRPRPGAPPSLKLSWPAAASSEKEGKTSSGVGVGVDEGASDGEKEEEEESGICGCASGLRKWLGGRRGSLVPVLTVHTSLVVYAFCYQISHVVLPYLAEDVHMDTVQYGGLVATFCALQLIGGVLFGRAGDVFSSKAMMVVAHISAGVSYSLMSVTTTKLGLYISEIPGLLQHGMQGSNMLVANMSSDKDRIKALGRLGFSYGLGAILGPIICGQMMDGISMGINDIVNIIYEPVFGTKFQIWSGIAAVLWVAIGATIITLFLLIILVPSSVSNKEDAKKYNSQAAKGEEVDGKTSSTRTKLRNVFSMTAILKLARYKFVRRLLLAKFGILFPSALFMSMFAQFCVAEFHFDPGRTGRLLSYVPLVRMLGQGLFVNPLVRCFSESWIIRGSCFVVSLSMLLIGQATKEWHLYVTLLPLNLSGAVAIVVISGLLTQAVPTSDTGGVLGLDHAVLSLANIVAPLASGWIYEAYGFRSLGYLGSVIAGLTGLCTCVLDISDSTPCFVQIRNKWETVRRCCCGPWNTEGEDEDHKYHRLQSSRQSKTSNSNAPSYQNAFQDG